MRGLQLGALAAAAGVQGFLIPPEVSKKDTDIVNSLPFEDALGVGGRVIELNCPGCPVVTGSGGELQSLHADSLLQLNFSTAYDNGAGRLLLNGYQLYPIDPQSATFLEPLTASQMIKSADETWQYASHPKLGYSLTAKHPAPNGPDQLDLVIIHLEIIEVADTFVNGLPVVDLQLLGTPTGQLILGNTDVNPPASPPQPTADDQECHTLLCRWRAIVADRLAALKKGCGSRRPSSGGKPALVPEPIHAGGRHHAGRPPMDLPHRPQGSSRHDYHNHGAIARFIRGLVLHVFVPVLIGIMVGIIASLVGTVAGHIVVFAWRLFFRRGQSQYVEVRQDESGEETDHDSKGFLQHQDPPPQYVDAVPEKKETE
ncbi:hypothetical protein PZA11_005392 [Diplocarpon coronariae]|nr:hypothetical protein JHW43_007593 [Diplocarpon mali]